MSVLHDAVCLQVVRGDVDVPDAVLLCEPVHCLNEGLPVVGHDFFERTPSAQDIFEDEGAEEGAGFASELPVFGVGGERASGLDDIAVASDSGHKHGVEVGLPEERGGCGNCRRDAVISHLGPGTGDSFG